GASRFTARRFDADASPMKSLELVLLGGFQARAAGQVVDVLGRKERALLAVLAMPPGEPRSREKLAGLLWSDRSDKQARDSLKQALLRLRKSFGSLYPLPMVTDRASVTLDAEITVDVQEFEQLVAGGTLAGLARATELYRGDLLEGLDVRDPAFEEWLLSRSAPSFLEMYARARYGVLHFELKYLHTNMEFV